MGESNQHKELVKLIINYIENFVGSDYACLIESDLSDNRPLTILTEEGFRPDVVYEYKGLMMIGEAKTSNDVSRKHSLDQYASYLKKCSLYHGNAEYIMAVPWREYASANNIINSIKKKFPGDYKITIIKGMV